MKKLIMALMLLFCLFVLPSALNSAINKIYAAETAPQTDISNNEYNYVRVQIGDRWFVIVYSSDYTTIITIYEEED